MNPFHGIRSRHGWSAYTHTTKRLINTQPLAIMPPSQDKVVRASSKAFDEYKKRTGASGTKAELGFMILCKGTNNTNAEYKKNPNSDKIF